MDSYDRDPSSVEETWWGRNKDSRLMKLLAGASTALVIMFFFIIEGCGSR